MNDKTNPVLNRRMLESHRTWAKKFGIDPADIRPQTLLLYAKLAANKETYYLQVTENGSVPVVGMERRLKESSLFFANQFALGLLKAPILSSVEYAAGAPIVFYPDKTIFSAAGSASALSEAQALEIVYHSTLTMKTDQGVRLDGLSCEVFRYAPTTQSGAAAQPSQGIQLVDLATSFFIWGNRKNEFQLQMPSTGVERTNIAGAATANNYLVLAIGGFEVVNAANGQTAAGFASFVESQPDGFLRK